MNGAGLLIGMVLGLTAVLALIALAFGLPAVNSGPDDVPLGIAGPPEVERMLEQRAPGAWDVTRYPDEARLRQAIEDRDEAGGIVAGRPPRILVASGGGPVIAQALRTVAAGIGGGAQVEDLAPLTEDDPAGAGIVAAGLPLIIGGILAGVAFSRLVAVVPRRLVGALAFAVLAGLALAALLRFVFGTIDEGYWLTAAGLALGIGAIALPAIGLVALLGLEGIGIVALLMVLIGNPLAGLATSPAWLPSPWGAIGQLFPPGAAGTIVRSAGFFDGRGASGAVVVLACWALAGLALAAVAVRRGAAARAGAAGARP
jgi:hypothetical protein